MWSKYSQLRIVLPIFVLLISALFVRAEAVEGDEAEQEVAFLTPTKGEPARRISLFISLEFEHDNRVYPYRLFVPGRVDANKTCPLLVWLHGYGESGDDNWRHLAYIRDEVARWEKEDGFPCFVLAPQSPYQRHWGDDVLSAVMQLVQRTVAEWPIDKSRIYAAGVSSGGSACWKIGAGNPKVFAALSPMASQSFSGNLAPLREIPIWAFHSTEDSPEGVRSTVAAIRGLNGPCWLTETPGGQHDCWSAAFREYDIIDWLLKQQRGSPAVPVPSWAKWKSLRSRYFVWNDIWPRAVLGGAIVVLTLVVRRHLRMTRSVAKPSAPDAAQPAAQSGITLVEVLVVIAIIGLLVALMLPAVQMARESSRRSSCANNLRQQAIAIKLHEQTHKIFPTGGWKDYLGDPDAGYGPKQTGGWIYNILPYIEEDDLRQLGRGLSGPEKEQALLTLMQTPVEVFYCPSRRIARLYPYTGSQLKNAKPPQEAAKTDYAISTTISYEKSEVIMPDIQLHGKGASKTVLAGEKWLNLEAYDTGGAGDSLVAYVGDSEDIRRTPTGSPASDRTSGSGFGGPHPGGANIAYCDGSVRFVLEDEVVEADK